MPELIKVHADIVKFIAENVCFFCLFGHLLDEVSTIHIIPGQNTVESVRFFVPANPIFVEVQGSAKNENQKTKNKRTFFVDVVGKAGIHSHHLVAVCREWYFI